MTALGNGVISCTSLDKTLGVRSPDTLITESSSVVAPGASLGKLFLVYLYSDKLHFHFDIVFLYSDLIFILSLYLKI